MQQRHNKTHDDIKQVIGETIKSLDIAFVDRLTYARLENVCKYRIALQGNYTKEELKNYVLDELMPLLR